MKKAWLAGRAGPAKPARVGPGRPRPRPGRLAPGKYLVNTDIKSLHTFIKEYTADKGDFITDFTEKLEQSIVFRVVPEESRAIILANCIEIIGKNKDLNFDLNVENLIKFQIAAEVTTQDKVDELSGKDKVDIIYANIGLSPLSILQDPADRLQLLQLAHTAGVNMKIFHDPGAINLLSVKEKYKNSALLIN